MHFYNLLWWTQNILLLCIYLIHLANIYWASTFPKVLCYTSGIQRWIGQNLSLHGITLLHSTHQQGSEGWTLRSMEQAIAGSQDPAVTAWGNGYQMQGDLQKWFPENIKLSHISSPLTCWSCSYYRIWYILNTQ